MSHQVGDGTLHRRAGASVSLLELIPLLVGSRCLKQRLQTLICTCSEGTAPRRWRAASGFGVGIGQARGGSQEAESRGNRHGSEMEATDLLLAKGGSAQHQQCLRASHWAQQDTCRSVSVSGTRPCGDTSAPYGVQVPRSSGAQVGSGAAARDCLDPVAWLWATRASFRGIAGHLRGKVEKQEAPSLFSTPNSPTNYRTVTVNMPDCRLCSLVV